MNWKTVPQLGACSSRTSVSELVVGPSSPLSAADDDRHQRPINSPWPGKIEPCRTASGGQGGNLKVRLLPTGSQCNWCSTGQMWSYRRAPNTRHAVTTTTTVFTVVVAGLLQVWWSSSSWKVHLSCVKLMKSESCASVQAAVEPATGVFLESQILFLRYVESICVCSNNQWISKFTCRLVVFMFICILCYNDKNRRRQHRWNYFMQLWHECLHLHTVGIGCSSGCHYYRSGVAGFKRNWRHFC